MCLLLMIDDSDVATKVRPLYVIPEQAYKKETISQYQTCECGTNNYEPLNEWEGTLEIYPQESTIKERRKLPHFCLSLRLTVHQIRGKCTVKMTLHHYHAYITHSHNDD